jgi:hypothetical protein
MGDDADADADADAAADAVASVGDDNVDSVIICGDAERSWATLTPGGKRAGGVEMAGRIGRTP